MKPRTVTSQEALQHLFQNARTTYIGDGLNVAFKMNIDAALYVIATALVEISAVLQDANADKKVEATDV